MNTSRILRAVIAFLAMCIIGMAAFLLYGVTVANNYNSQLRKLGIDASIAGVDEYIKDGIQLGVYRDVALTRLQALGTINIAKMGEHCEGVALTLRGQPGGYWGLFVPPRSPPSYRIGLCYADNQISEIIAYFRVGGAADGHPIPEALATPASERP